MSMVVSNDFKSQGCEQVNQIIRNEPTPSIVPTDAKLHRVICELIDTERSYIKVSDPWQ